LEESAVANKSSIEITISSSSVATIRNTNCEKLPKPLKRWGRRASSPC